LGLYAFHANGVAHSNTFSAIIATTRNPSLDILSEGNWFGTFPLGKEVAKARLRLGAVGMGKRGHRVAFGMADQVTEMRKGDGYI
jgi:hypothetical protein